MEDIYNSYASNYTNTPSDVNNISTVDNNLSIPQLFKTLERPSLARSILKVHELNGPVGVMFAVDRKITKDADGNITDIGLSIKSTKTKVEDQMSVKVSSVSLEVLEDVDKMFKEDGRLLIARLLNGVAIDYENQKLQEWLDKESVSVDPLVLDTPDNSTENCREITQYVQELVLFSNLKRKTSFNAFCVLPYKACASILADPLVLGHNNMEKYKPAASDYFIGKSVKTEFYLNPNADIEYAYVGIMSNSAKDNENEGCGSFNPYTNELIETQATVSTMRNYFIYNRFAITTNPLHSRETPMLFKFKIDMNGVSKNVNVTNVDALTADEIKAIVGS